MYSISGTYRIGVVTMFNSERKFGFARADAGDKFFFHLHQYCAVRRIGGNLRLERAAPESAPKEGAEIVFWAVKGAPKEGRSPAVENWTYLPVWEEAQGSAHAREAAGKAFQG